MPPLQTPFRKFHLDAGAKMVDFAGWEMPLHYGSILDEHRQTRESGSIFDVSHMGRLHVTGRHARKLLETVLTRKVSDMKPRTCRYALICNERGGVMDDVLVYRYDEHWLVVCNASNRAKVVQHFEAVRASGGMSATVEDTTEKTAMLAVQGPAVIEQIGEFSKEIPTLKRYQFAVKNLLVLKMTVSRTGYSGEDGVEVTLGANMANMAIKLLLKDKGEAAAIKPAGLGARDSLRLEAGMPLYGHELDEDTDPFSAGLDFGVTLDKHLDDSGPPIPRFIGQDALERLRTEGTPKTLVGLKVHGTRTPRQGALVTRDGAGGASGAASGGGVGVVTSGCMSPTLGHPIAMAYLTPDAATMGDTVQVTVGSATADAELVPLPFYRRG